MSTRKHHTSIKIIFIIAAALPACGPLADDPVLNDLGLQMRRAKELEGQGYSPGDAFQAAGPLRDRGFGGGSGFGGFGGSPLSRSSTGFGY